MTGFGRSSSEFGQKTFRFELRTLNSKVTDIRLKMPARLKEKEAELRKVILDYLNRGKIDVNIDIDSSMAGDEFELNKGLIKNYFNEISKIADELKMKDFDAMTAILRLPNIVTPVSGSMDEDEWEALVKGLKGALDNLDKFRRDEGKAMEVDLRFRIEQISNALTEVDPFEKQRIATMRERMNKNLNEFLGKENVDKNRFEQEVLHFLEKIDITEEKVRLKQHCLYFIEQLNETEIQKGRKLNFIAQEMGREINTLGAKAYSSDIQRIVVKMKDELEKIKEQVANIV